MSNLGNETIIVKGSSKHSSSVDGEFILEPKLRNGKYCFTRQGGGGIFFHPGKRGNYWKISSFDTGITSDGFLFFFSLSFVVGKKFNLLFFSIHSPFSF